MGPMGRDRNFIHRADLNDPEKIAPNNSRLRGPFLATPVLLRRRTPVYNDDR